MEAFESVVLCATRYGLTVSLATIAFNINEGGFLLRGQTGDFTIDVDGMPVRIEQDGMFGLGMKSSPYHGFSAHAVDYQKPFISETGYRSFMGCHAEMAPGHA